MGLEDEFLASIAPIMWEYTSERDKANGEYVLSPKIGSQNKNNKNVIKK